MTNGQIYRKTIGFTFRRLLWDVLSVVILVAISALGYFAADNFFDNGPIGLVIGAVVGIIVIIILLRFVSYVYKAGQIAMMTRGITEGELPDDVIAEGKRVVRERFVTVAVFFAITGAIKGIFNQIGRGLTKVGQSIGGDTGGAVGNTVSSILQTIVRYLSDCCLGWIFFRSNVKPARAACEGAVLFFRHGKTFFKNMGRVFGIGLASLVAIGGICGGVIYALIAKYTEFYESIAKALAEDPDVTEQGIEKLSQNPQLIPIVLAALGGLIIWSIIHSVLIRPFVLTGVLRNFIESGRNEIPMEESFYTLDERFPKFRKLHSTI